MRNKIVKTKDLPNLESGISIKKLTQEGNKDKLNTDRVIQKKSHTSKKNLTWEKLDKDLNEESNENFDEQINLDYIDEL